MNRRLVIATLLAALAPQTQAAQVADYRFNGDFSDALGISPALTELDPGSGAWVTAQIDGLPVQHRLFLEGTGYELSTLGLVNNDEYTISMLLELDQTDSYAKFLDVSGRNSDTGLYAQSNTLRLYTGGSGLANAFPPDRYVQATLTRDATHTVVGYVDGIEQFSLFDDPMDPVALISVENLLTFLRDDDSTGNSENSAGHIARIRIFDTALDATEVAALEADRVWLRVFGDGFED